MLTNKLKPLLALVVSLISMQVSMQVSAAELTVSASSSLNHAVNEIAQAYQAAHPETKIHLNFAASGALLQQIAKGAPVDVFASADQESMDAAEQQGLLTAQSRHDFARNSLVLIQPIDSKLRLERLADLNQASVSRIALGNPTSVPAGRYGKQALQAAQIWPAVESKLIPTQNVRQALDYVARAEVDAGFVYITDALIMKDKVKQAFPIALEGKILYPIARLRNSSKQDLATSWIDFVRAAQGQAILAKYGFLKP